MRFIIALIMLVFAAPAFAQGTGRIIEIKDFPTTTVAPRNISIWLPPGYDTSGKTRYPVIYMHDGQNIFLPGYAYGGKEWGIDEAMSRLIAARQVRPAIIVGVWNTDKRYREYFPSKWGRRLPPDSLARHERFQPGPDLADNYLSFLVHEVKPYIDSHYRTLTSPQNTGVMGSSMGGLISLYAIAEYPKVFGRAACVSIHLPMGQVEGNDGPAVDEPQRVASALASYLDTTRLKPDGKHRLYLDQGTGILDKHYTPYFSAVENVLQARGWHGNALVTRVFEGADHNEAAWRQRSEVLLSFLLDPPAK